MAPLKEGDKAPYFEGINQDGKKITLEDFKGKKLILYFYPTRPLGGALFLPEGQHVGMHRGSM